MQHWNNNGKRETLFDITICLVYMQEVYIQTPEYDELFQHLPRLQTLLKLEIK